VAERGEDEELVRLLVEESADVLAAVGSDGTVRYVSAAAEPLTGWDRDRLVGRPLLGLVHPDDRTFVREGLAGLADEPGHIDLRYRLIRADGDARWVESRVRVCRRPKGSPGTLFLSTTRDLSREVALEEMVRAGDVRVEVAAAAGRVALWEWFPDQDRMTADALFDLLGYPPEARQEHGGVLGELVHPEDQDAVFAAVQKGLGSPQGGYRFECRIRDADGVWRFFRVLGRLAEATPGNRRVVGATIDVTAQRRRAAEREAMILGLQERLRDLRRLAHRRQDLVDELAHELQNAAFALTGQVDEARDELEPDRPALARDLAEVAGRIQDLAGRVLAAAGDPQSAAGGVERIEVGPLAGRVLRRYRARAERKGIGLDLVCDPAVPDVEVEPIALDEVLANLVGNAIKFSPEGARVEVRLTSIPERQVGIEVADRGPGFTPEDRRRLFQRHAALSARPTGGEGSTGLGLHLVRRLVDAMDGNLSIENRPGGGAVLRVELPAATGGGGGAGGSPGEDALTDEVTRVRTRT